MIHPWIRACCEFVVVLLPVAILWKALFEFNFVSCGLFVIIMFSPTIYKKPFTLNSFYDYCILLRDVIVLEAIFRFMVMERMGRWFSHGCFTFSRITTYHTWKENLGRALLYFLLAYCFERMNHFYPYAFWYTVVIRFALEILLVHCEVCKTRKSATFVEEWNEQEEKQKQEQEQKVDYSSSIRQTAFYFNRQQRERKHQYLYISFLKTFLKPYSSSFTYAPEDLERIRNHLQNLHQPIPDLHVKEIAEALKTLHLQKYRGAICRIKDSLQGKELTPLSNPQIEWLIHTIDNMHQAYLSYIHRDPDPRYRHEYGNFPPLPFLCQQLCKEQGWMIEASQFQVFNLNKIDAYRSRFLKWKSMIE